MNRSPAMEKPLNPEARPWTPEQVQKRKLLVHHKGAEESEDKQMLIRLLPHQRIWKPLSQRVSIQPPPVAVHYLHGFPHYFYCPQTNFPPPATPVLRDVAAADSGGDQVVERVMGFRKKGEKWNAAPRFTAEPHRRVRRVWLVKKNDAAADDAGLNRRYSVPSPPPRQLLVSSSSSSVNTTTTTTVMIKNIPNKYRRHMFLEFLDKCCIEESTTKSSSGSPSKQITKMEYDFVYLPMDFMKGDNLGYAFVNFTSASAAMRIKESLQNYKWETVSDKGRSICHSNKICEVHWARVQGKEELKRHFMGSNFQCRTYDYLPVVFSPPRDGQNLSPPETLGKLAKF